MPRRTRFATRPVAPECARWPRTAGGSCGWESPPSRRCSASPPPRKWRARRRMNRSMASRSLRLGRMCRPGVDEPDPMPTFQYKALQSDGTIAEGRLEAGGRQEAFRQMEGRGLRPISLAEHGNGKPQKPNGKTKKPDTPKTENVPAAEADGSAPAPFKLSFGRADKISSRTLENFTRLLSSL